MRPAGPQRILTAMTAAVLVGVPGCTGGDDPPLSGGPGTPTPATTPASTAVPPSSAPEASAPVLPESCSGLVGAGEVATAVARPLPGPVSYLYAGPLPEVGRTGRITCGFGVRAQADRPVVEVSLIGYTDVATAAERIDLTVADAVGNGEQVAPQTLSGNAGYRLAGPDRTALVTAVGNRTVVVSLANGAVRRSAVPAALEEIAVAVLDRLPGREPAS